MLQSFSTATLPKYFILKHYYFQGSKIQVLVLVNSFCQILTQVLFFKIVNYFWRFNQQTPSVKTDNVQSLTLDSQMKYYYVCSII